MEETDRFADIREELRDSLSSAELAEIENYIETVQQGLYDGQEGLDLLLEQEDQQDQRDLRVRIGEMSLPEKIKLAMFGDATCRSILILDSNRIVPAFVLNNPKLQLSEVEAFAANHNVSDLVLRQISEGREWVKSYGVKLGLATNPKTPPDLAMRWLRHLLPNDLKKIAKSKNVPQLIAVTAKKLLQHKGKP